MIAPDTALPEESVTEPLRTANACALAWGGNDITLPPNRHTWATAQNCRSASRVIGAPSRPREMLQVERKLPCEKWP
jgi:hypothetical protein